MELSESNKLRSFKCSKCNDIQDSLDMVTDQSYNVIDAYNKNAQKRKTWRFFSMQV